jgi:hypothetical protein
VVEINDHIGFNAVRELSTDHQWLCTAAWKVGAKVTDLKGQVIMLEQSGKAGFINFGLPEDNEPTTRTAHFLSEDVYLNGKAASELWPQDYNLCDFFPEGIKVNLDVDPPLYDNDTHQGVIYNASLVWIGPRPRFVNTEQVITRINIDKWLEPAESARDIKKDDLTNYHDYGQMFDCEDDGDNEIPQSVQDVVHCVLREDHG